MDPSPRPPRLEGQHPSVLLYNDRFRRETAGDAASDSSTTVAQENYRDSQGVSLVSSTSPTPTPVGDDGRLLEAGEMEKIASSMKVRFEWPQTDDRFGVEEALRARRRCENMDVDSLLQQ